MGEFVHLHLHTEYSLLDGASRISEIADKALREGQHAVAITDHGVMYGAVDFHRELSSRGIKPIIGCEVYVAPRSRFMKDGKQDSSGDHLVLLCKNEVGYRNLCYLVSMSFTEGFYMKPRIDLELLREHHEGLIALSGCLAGRIPSLILAGSMSEAEKYALTMKSIFGEDFYLEIQNHHLDDEIKVAFALRTIGERNDIPLVATNDVHYLEKEDADLQATLMCIQMGTVVTEGRPLGFSTDEYYFRSTKEMQALFHAYPEAIANTVKIAEKCNFEFEFGNLYLPNFTSSSGRSHKEQLRADAYLGLERRIEEGKITLASHPREEYEARIEYELSVIDTMGFNAYFLIVSDFVAYAKGAGIPVGPGRGSGAGSLVAFAVGITDVDPIAFDLLFERFLNPERVSMPDFDIDFCYDRREEVIDYVKRKYGEDKVAQIVTFGTLAARAAVRDVGRALGMPYSAVDTVAKLIPRAMNVTVEDAMRTKELRALYEESPEVKKLLDIARRVEGMPRHASTHAAGVVITEEPTYRYVPLSHSGTGVVTQFDMTTSAKLGLVKFDFLGLRYLTVISDAEKYIRERHPDFSVERIPLDDEMTYKLLCDGRTDGVFQLESGGMKQVLSRLAPSSIEDIIACIALYRPGPMDSIDKFIARKHGREPIEYKVPALADILGVTYGCIVYQEQVMQICRALAGYSYAKADNVRRAMAKKNTEVMLAEREAFLLGTDQNGIPRDAAEEIFEEMVGFAKYAFNKSHATAYAMLSYRTAYLKAHYPCEYFSALMTSVLDSSSKLREYISDAKTFGVTVLRPDINESRQGFSVGEGSIRYGLLAIRNVGRNFADAVVRERMRAPFRSFDDFVERMSGAELNKRTLEYLIKSGVFDSLGIARSVLYASHDLILASVQEKSRNNITGQMDMFSMSPSDAPVVSGYRYPTLREYSYKELLMLEKESSGMYFSGHLADDYSDHIATLKTDKVSEIIEDLVGEEVTSPRYRDKSEVRVAGIVTAMRTKIVKNGETMAFVRLDDKYAEIEVVVFARQYKKYKDYIEEEAGILITGTVSEEDGEDPKILLSSLEPLLNNADFASGKRVPPIPPAPPVQKAPAEAPKKEAPGAIPRGERLFIKTPTLDDERVESIRRIAEHNPGKCPVVLYDESRKAYSVMIGVTLTPTARVLVRLQALFGQKGVVYQPEKH